MVENNIDTLFEQYAKDAEREANANSHSSISYDDVQWSGCEINKPLIFRAVGGPPNAQGLGPANAKSVNIAWVIGDDGKMFKLVYDDDPSNLINKIISKVTEPAWRKDPNTGKNVRYCPVQEEHFEIYNRVTKNGLAETDRRYKFNKGWKGNNVIIMNIIDRSRMDWHREHKHTVLLAKNVDVRVNPDGKESTFVDEGVSYFATNEKFCHLFTSYGNWQNYDIAMTRTGNKNEPFLIVNASNSPREVKAEYRDLISSAEGLTEEELSWERYPIDKYYHPTSMTKVFNRLKTLIKRIDAELGTSFYEELNVLVEKEKIENEKRKAEAEAQEASTAPKESAVPSQEAPSASVSTTKESVQPTAPIATRGVSAPVRESVPSTNNAEKLQHYAELPENVKEQIVSVTFDADNKPTIEWVNTGNLAACPDCGTPAPWESPICPHCGKKF